MSKTVSPTTINVGIIGATGYTGRELLRLLAQHPVAKLTCVTSQSQAGQAVDVLFPSLRGQVDLRFCATDEAPLSDCAAVFCAAPNGVAMQYAAALLSAGVKVIDLSADFRLKDVQVWQHWYGMTHACPQLLAQAVYGLPEMSRADIRQANLVANPGCYPTAVQLGFLPLLEAGLVRLDSLVADAKSGVSGAGRKAVLGTAFAEVAESCTAYSVDGHRHLPEIKQGLARLAAVDSDAIDLVFTPHLLPMIRGIHATLYAKLKPAAAAAWPDVQALYATRFAAEPYVDVLPPGSHPHTASVRGSNVCRLAVHRPQAGDTLVVLVVEDNLVKGAAGQAIQNMNLMFGLDETSGLDSAALFA